MNLRGGVVPIVDLRRRFELPSKEPQATRRILVVAVGGERPVSSSTASRKF